jgi:membrane protease YdiL (CAAX protease family)
MIQAMAVWLAAWKPTTAFPATFQAAAPLGGRYDGLLTLAKAVAPIAAFVAIAPVLWFVFRRTWRELDVEANEHQRKVLAAGKQDLRPAVLFAITAIVLTMQEYYGTRLFFDEHLRPVLRAIEASPSLQFTHVNLSRYSELYGFAWWGFTRVFGYIAVPMLAWKLIFRRDSLLDMGLRTRGVTSHAWLYALCLAVVVPIVFVVARSPDFGSYYPFYKQCSRSWMDLIAWECIYIAQFFGLEIFFRGFWLSGLRKSLGSGAIFAMCVPYCMIHFGKPYLEASGAVIAGIALGSLAMRTKSIYAGFFVHVVVALTMDFTSLVNQGALPTSLWP